MTLEGLVNQLNAVGIQMGDQLPQLYFTQWDDAGFEHEYSAHIEKVGTTVIFDDRLPGGKETVPAVHVNCIQDEGETTNYYEGTEG